MQTTRPLHDRIVLAFDFDETLGESSLAPLLSAMGLDRDRWQAEFRDGLDDATWDAIPARAYALIAAGRASGRPLSRSLLAEAARTIRLYDGVCEMPERLRAKAETIAPGIELDFVVLSSGYVDIIENTAIGACFDRIWGSSLHFDDKDEAVFIKRALSHPDKARYLEALSKGIDIASGANAPAGTTKAVSDEDKYAPPHQMIFCGDGASDLEAFQYVEAAGGIAIAVRQDGGFRAAKQMHARQRPSNLAPADYSEGAELMQTLTLAVESIAARVAIARLGQARAD